MSNSTPMWEQPRQPTRLHGWRHCGGACGSRTGAVREQMPFAAGDAAESRRDAQLLQLGRVVNPKTYHRVLSGDRHHGQKVVLRLERDAATQSSKPAPAVTTSSVPIELHERSSIIAEKLNRADRLVEAEERQEGTSTPKFHNTTGRPGKSASWVVQGLGHDRLHVSDGARSRSGRRPGEEFVALTKNKYKGKTSDGRPAHPRSPRLDRDGCSATRITTENKEGSWTRYKERCSSSFNVHVALPTRSNYDATHRESGKAVDGPRPGAATARLLASKDPAQVRRRPEEGGEIWVDAYSIPVGAKNPDAAHAWISFFVYDPIDAVQTSYMYYGSPLKRPLLRNALAKSILGDLLRCSCWPT